MNFVRVFFNRAWKGEEEVTFILPSVIKTLLFVEALCYRRSLAAMPNTLQLDATRE